ncbi:MAG TPA: alpha/beta fold hydrolase [Solirubrobacteraceae bacterium]|nr:alpha/beta fold hydrolase [Solirubrobacteraceae bacterium]
MTAAPARAPIVLIHGVGLDHRMWDACRAPLSRVQPVEAPDLPGHGSAPVIRGRVELADLARPILERIARAVHLVGFSLGALVAQRIALDAPERVRSLILLSSVARRSAAERAAVEGRLRQAREEPTANRHAAIQRWTGGEAGRLSPDAIAYAERALAAMDPASYLAAYRVFVTAEDELWPRVGEIAAPTLVVTGEEDPGSTPRMTRELAAAIPGACAEIVAGARHLLPLERPDTVSGLILDHVRRHDGHD